MAVAVLGDVIEKVPTHRAVQQRASLDGYGEVLVHFIAQD